MATLEQVRGRTTWVLVALALVGIGLRAWTLFDMPRSDLCGADFPIFYAGGQLVGSSALYSAAAVREIELRVAGCSQPPALFVRPPYFAAWMIPWSRISYWPSFWLWRMAMLAVAGIFIWLWPAPREWSLLACAWSLPLAYSITNGQDSGFLLLWLALAVLLVRRGREFEAGMALAMCAPKFHLFFLVPLLLIGRRRMLWGGAMTAAGLIALAFAVQGPHWPAQFVGAITNPGIAPIRAEFFNLRSTAHGNTLLEVLLGIPLAAAVWYVNRHADFELALAAALAGGLLVSHQETMSDVVLLTPAALILAAHARAGYSKVLAVFLASPLGYFLMNAQGLCEVPRMLTYAMVLLIAWESRPLSYSRPAAAAELMPESGVQSA